VNGFHPETFCGDFDVLPLRAHLLYGPVPTHPTSQDFQNAGCSGIDDEAAARWRLEAIRWRMANPFPMPLDLRAIANACAAKFYAAAGGRSIARCRRS
jgi:hypothetical protein